MKLQSIVLSVTLTIVSLTAFGQEVKIKKEIASVDGKEYVRVGDCGMFATECSIRNMEGEELIKLKTFKDEKNLGTYFQLSFVGLETKVELKKTIKPLLKLIYENKTITPDGKLDATRVKVLFEKYGNQISSKK